MRNVKLTIAFDGSRYKGWQRLKNEERTIQGKLEETLSKITGEPIALIGCGRTDAGVHAKEYVANFHTKSTLSAEQILKSLRQFLPEDIAVLEAKEADERFHARYGVKKKVYEYRVDTGFCRNVFARKYQFYLPERFDIEAMRRAGKVLVGTHDFASFTSLKSKKKSTVRTLYDLEITQEKENLIFRLCADGFLWHMVRIIVATLLDVGRGKIQEAELEHILEKRERAAAGAMVPPQGLCLMQVIYQD